MANPLAAVLRAKRLLNQNKGRGALDGISTTPSPSQSGPLLPGGRALPVDARPISLMEAFGSPELNAADKLGIKFQEKPSYMEDIVKSVHPSQIPLLEEALGRVLNTYNRRDIVEGANPLGDLLKENLQSPDEQMFILRDPETNQRHLVDRTGANKYIRMWSRIGDE